MCRACRSEHAIARVHKSAHVANVIATKHVNLLSTPVLTRCWLSPTADMAHKRQACVVAVQGLVLAQFPCNGLAHQYWQQAMSKAQYDCAKQTNLTSDTCAGVMSQRKSLPMEHCCRCLGCCSFPAVSSNQNSCFHGHTKHLSKRY